MWQHRPSHSKQLSAVFSISCLHIVPPYLQSVSAGILGGVHFSLCEPLNLHNNELLGCGKTNGSPPGAGFLPVHHKVGLCIMHTHKRGLWHILTRCVFFLHPGQDVSLTLKFNVPRSCPAHGRLSRLPSPLIQVKKQLKSLILSCHSSPEHLILHPVRFRKQDWVDHCHYEFAE